MHKGLRVDRLRTRGVDRRQDEVDLALRCPGLPIGILKLAADQLDVLSRDCGHLDFDPRNPPLRLLERAVSLHAASSGPVGHGHLQSHLAVTGLRTQAQIEKLACVTNV